MFDSGSALGGSGAAGSVAGAGAVISGGVSGISDAGCPGIPAGAAAGRLGSGAGFCARTNGAASAGMMRHVNSVFICGKTARQHSGKIAFAKHPVETLAQSRTPRPSASLLTPCEAARQCLHLPEPVFFDSAVATADSISIIAACPSEIVAGSSERDWENLRQKLRANERSAPLAGRGIPHGMAAGYVEYDGAFRFGFYHDLLIYEHGSARWSEVGDFWSKLQPATLGHNNPLEFQPAISRKDFCRMVERAQRYIAAGDIYQVNLSHRFTAPWDGGDLFHFYELLRRCSPAPNAAYLRSAERALLSASPESFLEMSSNRICSRPIKGTRPRRADPRADDQSAHELVTSAKEAAELIMITDLERNDLGQVCEYGSVRVPQLLTLERFAQVFHLVSTVEGRLRPEVDHVTALRACFPGGSITGAPKKRAREIIAELEPAPRGLYTGAIGYFGFNGESRFSIAIRTAVVEPAREAQRNAECGELYAHFHVGAGIVADSDPEMEYDETLHKAAGILRAAEQL